MPASPELQITINETALARVCDELDIVPPIIRITPAQDNRTLGKAHGGTVTIYYGLGDQTLSRLVFVTNEITRTLLHELRHVHQLKTWEPRKWDADEHYSYNLKPSEIDANDFASRRCSSYRDLVRVRRQGVGRLGRLQQAEGRIRQRM